MRNPSAGGLSVTSSTASASSAAEAAAKAVETAAKAVEAATALDASPVASAALASMVPEAPEATVQASSAAPSSASHSRAGKRGHRRTPTANGAWSAELLDRHLGEAMKDAAFVRTYEADGRGGNEAGRGGNVETGLSHRDSPVGSMAPLRVDGPHPPSSPQSPSATSPGRAAGSCPRSSCPSGVVETEELLLLLNSEAAPSGEVIGQVKMLLSRNLIMGTRALQQLGSEKEEMARELLQRSDQLNAAEESLRASEVRACALELKLEALKSDVRAAAARADP